MAQFQKEMIEMKYVEKTQYLQNLGNMNPKSILKFLALWPNSGQDMDPPFSLKVYSHI